MLHYLIIGLGGAIGAILRVMLGRILPSEVLGIPFYILCINILGCFLMGILVEVLALYWPASTNIKLFLASGFLGGFTTFSSFALECGLLVEEGAHMNAVIYVVLSVTLSITFFFIGMRIIRVIS